MASNDSNIRQVLIWLYLSEYVTIISLSSIQEGFASCALEFSSNKNYSYSPNNVKLIQVIVQDRSPMSVIATPAIQWFSIKADPPEILDCQMSFKMRKRVLLSLHLSRFQDFSLDWPKEQFYRPWTTGNVLKEHPKWLTCPHFTCECTCKAIPI